MAGFFGRVKEAGSKAARKIFGGTIPRAAKRGITVVGVGAISVGAAALLGIPLPPGLSEKAVEWLGSGAAVLSSAVAMNVPNAAQSPENRPPGQPLPTVAAYDPHLEVELAKALWRQRALDAAIALLAYAAIALPVGFLVLQISAEMPITGSVIVACYAYVGLIKFLGFTEFSIAFQRPAPPAAQVTAASES